MKKNTRSRQPNHIIALLIFSGETIFLLPFVLPRIFRPTYLDVFHVTNLELGTCYSIYGVVAMVSYFLGGIIADRFQPRKLMAVALLLTSLGGLAMATYPPLWVMKLIYGYWGCTTILLFWAAMIKATREWGGTKMQGKAFGFLDGGRGLVAAGIGTLGVLVFSLFLVGDVADATFDERRHAFSFVQLFATGLVGLVALAVWFWLKLPETKEAPSPGQTDEMSLSNIRTVLKIPSVWLLMVIILCGYVGYKLTDDFSLYAKEVMKYDEVQAAQIGSLLFYLRPIIGVSAGFFADRSRSSSWMLIGFVFMLTGSVLISSGVLAPGMVWLFIISMVSTSVGVFAIRSLYFASMQEGLIPLSVTGTAVGVISLVGFTPDIFVGPIMGYLLDSTPGEAGHQQVFMMLAVFSALGLVALMLFRRSVNRQLKEKALSA